MLNVLFVWLFCFVRALSLVYCDVVWSMCFVCVLCGCVCVLMCLMCLCFWFEVYCVMQYGLLLGGRGGVLVVRVC